jgi:hypothetical protein
MDTELLVDDRITEGQMLVEQLIKDNFDVGVAFWVKTTDDGAWQLYLASSEVGESKPSEAYRRLYYSLNSLSLMSISNLDVRLVNDSSPIAQAAIEFRDRLPTKGPSRYYGKNLGPLSVKEVYIYPKIEIPVRQSFLVSYIREGSTNTWRATTQRKEFYRGHAAKGAVSYSKAQWAGEKPEDQRFALIYVMVEVSPGLDESAILTNPIMIVHLSEQAQLLADQMFKERNPDSTILHEPLAIAHH